MVVPSAADRFPAPDPEAAVVAISLGHLGHRTDWALLRAVAERMPELVLLLVGEWHADEAAGDADFAWCRSAPGLVWLGRRSDEEAARLVLCADVGIVPFERSAFNDAGLPNRILKYARLGRFTVTPPLAGSLTWERALLVADGPDAFVAALRSQAGARHPARRRSCARGRSPRPPGTRTGRCGSAWRRSASPPAGSAASALGAARAGDVGAKPRVAVDRREARVGHVGRAARRRRRSRSGAGPSG